MLIEPGFAGTGTNPFVVERMRGSDAEGCAVARGMREARQTLQRLAENQRPS